MTQHRTRPLHHLYHLVIGKRVGSLMNFLIDLYLSMREHVLLLLALRVGHEDHGAVAPGVAHPRQTKARVARRALGHHRPRGRLRPRLAVSMAGCVPIVVSCYRV